MRLSLPHQWENYLYQSKEECCEMHFWWRITQCMDNEHPMYESNGEFCEIKVNLDQWEVKYTPQTWESSVSFCRLPPKILFFVCLFAKFIQMVVAVLKLSNSHFL